MTDTDESITTGAVGRSWPKPAIIRPSLIDTTPETFSDRQAPTSMSLVDHFEMSYIDTMRHRARMIDHLPFGDGSVLDLPSDAMSIETGDGAVAPDLPVALG